MSYANVCSSFQPDRDQNHMCVCGMVYVGLCVCVCLCVVHMWDVVGVCVFMLNRGQQY